MAFSLALGVNTDALEGQANQVESITSNIAQHLKELDDILQATSGYWIGDGGTAFRREFHQHYEDASGLMQRLKRYSPDLRQIAGIYGSAEGAGDTAASSLSISADLST